MDIRNVTQFASFVSSNGLITLDLNFKQIAICIGDFMRYCGCHRQADKDRIYQNCNRIYIEAVKLAATRFKNEFLSKTTDRQIAFYLDNNQLIATVSR